MAFRVEADDLQLEDLALLDHVPRVGDALVGELADVNQALQALLDADEGAEVHELRHGPVDQVADVVLGDRLLPGSGCSRRIERLIRPRSWLMSMTSASTSSPIA